MLYRVRKFGLLVKLAKYD